MYDIAIIGGGPAGITAAIYALRAGKKTALFEGDKLGGTLNEIKKMDNYPGFKSISGKALIKKLETQLMALNPEIFRQFIVKVMREEETDSFTLYSNTAEYQAKKVIYCGGSKPKTIKAATNFSGDGVSYCATCDGYFYRDKTVAVVGTGYTAEEDVHYLKPLCKKVYLIGKIPGLDVEQIDSSVEKILGGDKVNGILLKNGQEIAIDGLFIALGGASESDIFDEDITRGVFRAGDVTGEFKQVVWACAAGAKAVSNAIKEK